MLIKIYSICHSERSEESPSNMILRFTQDDVCLTK